MTRRIRLRGLVTSLCLAATLVAIPAAAAENVFQKATGAVGDFFRRVVELLRISDDTNEDLEQAIDTYANGDYFTTWLHANRIARSGVDWLADEADLLAGLTAAAAGVHEEAASRLRGVLDAESVSPYYPVALAALLELEARFENHDAAAEVASKYLADFWYRPRSVREAAIKAVFLETGAFTPDAQARRSASGDREIGRRPDRPTERAVYLAGVALLRSREFERAADCFEALAPPSSYYAYARYGLAQASYGLRRYARAARYLSDVHRHAGMAPGEIYLRDRASLLAGQILHEIDEDSAAIGRLRQVSATGPFGLHAALLAAEIQVEREKPALALVYLKDRPQEGVEPKLVAQAAALDARLHRALEDSDTAVRRLEEGIRALTQYEARLEATAGGEDRIAMLLRPLEGRQRVRDRVEAWRRENLANAIPDLLHVDTTPGIGSRLFASAIATANPDEGVPVIYYPRPFDP
ncbi:MAG: hypothetical protein ACREQ9_02420, partial [Candidatus Binatia bacterium]